MKILIEGYAYDREVVKGAIPGGGLLFPNKNGKIPIDRVGYYRSPECDDFVFFLPKVLLEPVNTDEVKGDRVFCKWSADRGERKLISSFAPEDIVDLDVDENGDHPTLPKSAVDFLYGFAIWIYQALARFDDAHPCNEVVWKGYVPQAGAFRRRYVTNTLLDVILALRRFNRDNQDYILFKVQEKHSGHNKINWTRTISKSTAIIQNGAPVYVDLLNKKKVIDFDEELLVIYYSILNYIRKKYNFDLKIGVGYELITGDRFVRYLEGYGETRLRQIKYKYFSDRDLQMWELCFAFFSKAHKTNVSSADEEYLVAKDFEVVFESMIDDLLGDKELAKLKDLDDGKEIDHLYLDDSLTRRDGRKTFYIADSKYYKLDRALEYKSVAKQFTYARDMLQLNLDLFLPGNGEQSKNVDRWRRPFSGEPVGLLRDGETEGYDVIPNFFISATMNENFDYEADLPTPRQKSTSEGGEYHNIHFENRLFDRDTLILRHYNLNFLYVLKLYAQNDEGQQTAWKDKVRKIFRDEIRSLLGRRFLFKAIMPHEGVDAQVFFRENFKDTQGKVYSPYPHAEGQSPVYLLAVEDPKHMFEDYELLSNRGVKERGRRIEVENERVLGLIKQYFYVLDDVKLGDDPVPALINKAQENRIEPVPALDPDSGAQVVSHATGHLMSAVDACGWCPCPVDQCPNPDAVRTLVLPYSQGAHLYRVVPGSAVKKSLDSQAVKAEFGSTFDSIGFPSSVWHFWNVEKIC